MTADLLLAHEPAIRLTVFLGLFAVLALAELRWPRRALIRGRKARWTANLSLMALYTLPVRLLAPLAAVGVAAFAQRHGLGLFNAAPAPPWLAILASLVLLDLVIWGQHLAFHRIPWLWPLHRVHHADVGFDLTTGVRFHPLEVIASLAVKAAAVTALGAPPAAVLAFEVLLSGGALFSHANLRLPEAADRALRRVWVTPDMHRVHHSQVRAETDSNYGFHLSLWDRLFGTYRAQPAAGQAGVVFGQAEWSDPREDRPDRLLTQPFRRAR